MRTWSTLACNHAKRPSRNSNASCCWDICLSASLWIPGPLPGINDLVGKGRWAYGKTKKEWTEHIAWLAKAARLPAFTRARFDFLWVERDKKRNPDNIAGGGKKVVFDGLVEAKVLPNDGWKQIAKWSDDFEVDAKRPGVLVTLTAC